MKSQAERHRRLVGAALATRAASVAATGPCSWRCVASVPVATWIDVRWDAKWLTAVTRLQRALREGDRWRFLALNAALPGAVRIALSRRAQRPVLRVDVPMFAGESESGPLPIHRVHEMWESMEEAICLFSGVAPPARATGRESREETSPRGESNSLAGLCRAAGWKVSERAPAVVVDLDVPGSASQATLLPDAVTGVRAQVVLLRGVVPTAPSREAVAVFLLSAADALHLARPIAARTAEGVDLLIDVQWQTQPSQEEIGRTLQALSVACRSVARETEALCERRIAVEYLRVHGLAPDRDAA